MIGVGGRESNSFLTTSSTSSNIKSVKYFDKKRMQLLKYPQVRRLDMVMSKEITVHSNQSGLPSIKVRLRDFIMAVKQNLSIAGVHLRDIRLNGGVASHIISDKAMSECDFNDYDIIFNVSLSTDGCHAINQVKVATLDALVSFLSTEEQKYAMKIMHEQNGRCWLGGMSNSIGETYIHKLFRIVSSDEEADYWSLIGLGNSNSIELKFVERMRRPYEFTVDSFQIVLDSLLMFYSVANMPISSHFYPTIIAESMAGNFEEALHHLKHKIIFTRNPEQIHGGGLLKYCRLLVEGYGARPSFNLTYLERYMCTRFFIDYRDSYSQLARIESYLDSHFRDQVEIKMAYLEILRRVIYNSSMCLMHQERHETLQLIDSLITHLASLLYYSSTTISSSSSSSILPNNLPSIMQNNSIPLTTTTTTTTNNNNNINRTYLCQEDIGGEDWQLDEVFYGTQYFPDVIMSPSTPLSYTMSSGDLTSLSSNNSGSDFWNFDYGPNYFQ